MNRTIAKKIIEEQIMEDRTFDGHFDMIKWLYDNNYEVIKVEEPPKSKLMEEFMEELSKVGSRSLTTSLEILIKFIDKHKADK